MSFSNRDNPYTFGPFLDWRDNFDYYADDPFLQRLTKYFGGSEWNRIDGALRKFSLKVSFRWRDFAETAARPENRPYLLNYNGHNQRIDRIVRPMETQDMEEEVFREALFKLRNRKLWHGATESTHTSASRYRCRWERHRRPKLHAGRSPYSPH